MGRNDTPRTVAEQLKKHDWNWGHPHPGFEIALRMMVEGAVTYSQTYAMRFGVPLNKDPALGDEWLRIVRGLVVLLDGETGRFHCPSIDGLLRAAAEQAGFTLNLLRHKTDPLFDPNDIWPPKEDND